ncbi:DUF5067 domain-containing protein [Bombilactobacillus bombi]|uniref:DUF5067 domain-containing protein n=1 Tax=Bombilactobacillus bombi TaxID=1303590 RepID=UPI0015FB3A43|nr:DUF5067 domain-containing protein [Bombilactobacillus bombi]
MALPATVILIIAVILLFMHKKSKDATGGNPFYKVWWFWVITAALVIILFAAHSGSATSNNSNSSSSTSGETKVDKAKSNSNKRMNSDYSFKNGIFKGPKFTIKISQTKLGVDRSENSRGIIAYFEITNDSKKSFKPSEALYYLKFKQSNGKSNYDLDDTFDSSEALFPTHNDDGTVLDDNDAYEANSDKQDEFRKTYEDPLSADLLPGKTVTIAQGYKLKDQNQPVYVHGYANLYDGKSIGAPYKIDLK